MKLQKQKKQKEQRDRKEKIIYQMEYVLMFINAIISVVALAVSICSVYYSILYSKKSNNYSQKEYEYKVTPEIKVSYVPEEYLSEDGRKFTVKEVLVDISQRNNLKRMYAIYADGEVEKIDLDNAENLVSVNIHHGINEEKSEIVIDPYSYWYSFLCMEGLDGEYILYLLYAKSCDDFVQLNAVSGVEVYGLQYAHMNEKMYEGEKIMAKKYIEVLEGLSLYVG